MFDKERRTCVKCLKPEKTWLFKASFSPHCFHPFQTQSPNKGSQCFHRSSHYLSKFKFILPASSLEAADLGLNPQIVLETNYCHSYLYSVQFAWVSAFISWLAPQFIKGAWFHFEKSIVYDWQLSLRLLIFPYIASDLPNSIQIPKALNHFSSQCLTFILNPSPQMNKSVSNALVCTHPLHLQFWIWKAVLFKSFLYAL